VAELELAKSLEKVASSEEANEDSESSSAAPFTVMSWA
jgi:hypothetical protein